MSDSDLVLATTASSIFEAHLIRGLLESEGIPVYIPGANAMDEFGSAQRQLAVPIEVPRGRLEEAQALVEEARRDIEERRRESQAEDPDE